MSESATAISTVAVRSGGTSIVIALLQSKDSLELKVVDVDPCLTQLADTLEEASEWRKAHADVIHKIKSKKSPVAELGDQAESVMANQKTSPTVYTAMSDSLAAVWENVNKHLEERARILDLNLSYHKNAEEFHDHCRCLEILAESDLPVEIEDMRERMVDLKEGLRSCLSCLNGALRQGTALLDILIELEEKGSLDSRPQHIKLQAQLAKVQVERWMESLHEKRRWIQKKVEVAHAQLEECLALALITADLTLLKRLLTDRTEALLSSTDQLGDSTASAELLLHEHKKIMPEAKDLQEQALKIVRATEEFADGGHFAGPEAIRESYLLLEEASHYLDHISSRESRLNRAIEFFNSAHTALVKLDQLQVQLSSASMGLGSSTPKATVARKVEEISQPPLNQGYSLLQDVPGAEGVKRTVEQIENKKIELSVQLENQQEENTKAKEVYNVFMDRYNSLNAFLTSMKEYLKGVREMGVNLSTSKEYLQTYKKNLTELQNKGTEINAFVSTIPATMEQLELEQAQEVQQKGDELREVWSGLNLQLERRIRHCSAYSKALDLGNKLRAELDSLDRCMATLNEAEAKQIWVSVKQLKAQFDNTAANFERDSREVGTEGGLDLESGRQCLRELSTELSQRIDLCEEAWIQFSELLDSRHKDKQLWETNMAASNKTVDWVSKLDAQLYPVLNPELHSARQLVNHVEEKLNTVVPEIKRAQKEIQLRIDTAEALLSKSDFKGANEGIPVRLKELNSRLNTISADYQVLLEKLLTFFNSLAQVESKIETIQREIQTAPLARTMEDAVKQLREFEATKYAMSEMFQIALVDSSQIIDKVKTQEGPNGDSDVRTIERVVESIRYSWQRVSTNRESALSKQESRCRFEQDLAEVHKALDTLASQLVATRGRYGENIVEAKATSADFATFEKTIVLLEERINEFSRVGREIAGDESRFEREIQSLRNKWNSLREQVVESRRLINMAEVFFTLVDEAEDWFREGNRVLVSIAQRSTKVGTPQEAQGLLEEINVFLKPGEERQNRRIDEISQIALELWGEDVTSHLQLVKSGSKEILNSFNQVSESLKLMAERINTQHPIVEHMDVDVQVDSHSKPVEDWQSQIVSKHVTSSTTTIEQVNIRTESMTPAPPVEEEREKKSPSPPLKKIKVQEQAASEAPYFTTTLLNTTVREGNRFTFQCKVTGVPVPEIVWEKDGISIQNNPDYQVKFEDGQCSLTIEETFAEDSAKYTCRGHNEAGVAETSAYLSVVECEPEVEMIPPTFVLPLGLINCDEGRRLELRCHVTGVPLPTVQWFHEDKCLDDDAQLLITFNNGEAILVKEEAALSDHGQYSCLAVNQKGTEKTMARVIIHKKVEPGGESPGFLLELGNVMARAGQKIKLEAEVKGLPPPTISWSKDGKPIRDSRDIKITTEGSRSTLVIQEAFPKDAGVYDVTATNPAGTAVSSSQVTVKGRLPQESSDTEAQSDMEPTKPKVQLHLKDQSVFEGKKVRLDCVIVGVPEPEVIWYHDGQPVKESADIQLVFHGDRCSLIIQEALVEDGGNYKVVALNSAGEASSECSLNVQAVDKSGERATRKSESTDALAAKGDQQKEGAPKFVQLLSDQLIVAGETITLECVVQGCPLPDVSWALNNNELVQSDRIHMIQDMEGKCTLKIKDVSASDKGVYTARASNQQGEAKCFSHLTVKTPVTLDSLTPQAEDKTVPPNFTELFKDCSIPEGAAAKFECIVTGKPTPKVKWQFNEQPVSGKEFLVSTSGNRQVLSLPSVSKALAGKISCIAENEAGKATCVATLNVSEPSVETLLPSLDEVNLDSGVFEMKRAVFMQSSTSSKFSSSSVTSTGGGEPHVSVQSSLSKSEVASHKIGDQPAVQVESHKTSEYKNIDGVESKEETSSVKTNLEKSGSGVLKSSSGIVIGKRKDIPPKFRSPLQGCIVDQGVDVTLTAIVEGHPPPELEWSRNGGPLPQDCETSYDKGRAELKLFNVKSQQGGRYTCIATNPSGTASSAADVVVKKSSFPPVMGRRLQARTAIVGERVALEVEVTGTPTPTVSWFKDGQPIKPTSTVYRIINQGNCSTMVIDKVDHIHTGQYGATATNSAGEARSTADLLIVDPPAEAPKPSGVVFSDLTDGMKSELTRVSQLPGKEIITTHALPGGGEVVVSESFKAEQQMSMKVEKSSVTNIDDFLEFKKKVSSSSEEQKRETVKVTEVTLPSSLDAVRASIVDTPKLPFAAPKSSFEAAKPSSLPPKMEFEVPKPVFQVPKPDPIFEAPKPMFEIAKYELPKPAVAPLQSSQPSAFHVPKPTFDASKMESLHHKSSFEAPKPQPIDEPIQPTYIPFQPKPQQVFQPSQPPNFQTDLPSLQSFPQNDAINEDLVTESISKKSSLNFFQTLIKESGSSPKQEAKPKDDLKSQVQPSFSEATSFQSSSFEKQWKSEATFQPLILEPGPPPEMGYIPKTQAPPPKEQMSDRVKKLEESQRDLREFEIPSGGVKIFPTKIGRETPQSPIKPPLVVDQKSPWENKQAVKEEVIQPQRIEPWAGPILRPGADVGVRPTSPRPSAEGVSMEKLWTAKKEESLFSRIENVSPVNRAVSPISTDAKAMDKLWSCKHQDSSLNTWPPPGVESTTTTSSLTESKKSQFSSVETSFSSVLPPLAPQPAPAPLATPTTGNIIYVAEAHATHRSNINTFSKKSDFFESTQQSSESQILTETNITPAEAKKIWTTPAEPPKPRPKQEFKPIKSPMFPASDINLEPGPPPEIGFATPPPTEGARKQSFVEMMEHEIEKDLDKEPTKRLVGAVRIIPPLKRESSVESQKSIQVEKLIVSNKVERRANSFCDESFKSFPVLEPFPFKPSQGAPSPKSSTLPRPAKFKKQCTESDYESDLEGTKIRARWTPFDSDTDEPHYRKVKPPGTSGQPKRAQSEQPEPPTLNSFSSPPVTFTSKVIASTNQSQTEVQSLQSKRVESSSQGQPQQFNLKPGSPPQYFQTQPEISKFKQRPTPTDSGYMADTEEPRVARQKTSHKSEKSISVQQSTFKQEKKTSKIQESSQQISQPSLTTLEPFPFKPAVATEQAKPKVPLASPSKFLKGSFRGSDYESDHDSKNTRIPPMWTPTLAGTDRTFKPVEAPRPKFEPIDKQSSSSTEAKILRPQPQHFFDLKPGSPPQMDYAPPLNAVETSNSMSFAESTASSRRVVSMQQTTRVISFDQKTRQQQASLPSKIVPKGDAKWLSDSDSEVKSAVEVQAEEKRLQRVEEMRKRFVGEKSSSVIDLKPGEPPQFDYAPPRVPPAAATVANKHISEMTSTFKSKAQQFVSDVVTDVKQNGHVAALPKPTPSTAIVPKDSSEPQVYREENRLAEHGTKCIDPDTGLIYFKYDFGYEFGVVLPGEGGKPGSSSKAKAVTTTKRDDRDDGAIEVPVIHETTGTSPFAVKKKKQHKSVKWDPTSESEMSDVDDARRMTQGPKISYPNTPSPMSASPAPSPYASAGHDQGAVHWASGSSPLTSPVVVNAMLHSETPKKPPIFITPLRDIAVVSGLTARFECIVQAEPTPNVTWAKDGRTIEPSLNHEIQFRNGVCRLTIPQAFNYDAGEYVCSATNNLGTQKTSATLQVTGEARTYISK